MELLRVVNLSVTVGERKVLENINLYIEEGQTYVLFGPNGSGKTSLAMTLIGNPNFKIKTGKIFFKHQDITNWETNKRIKLGMGISFQNSPELAGVKFRELLEKITRDNEKITYYAAQLKMEDLLDRELNVGFSGGERKKAEILQLMSLNPDFVILDEPDSGVDIENIAIIGKLIRKLLQRDEEIRKKAGIIITHTGYILNYVSADYGILLYKGRIACIGNPYEMFESIMKYGYKRCMEKCLREYQNKN